MARIKRARVSFVSFVPRGANQLPGLYKSADGFEKVPMLKDDLFAEKGQLTAVVYAPDHRDAHGHIASAQVIEKMAHSFMEEGGKLDIKHDRRELTKDQAFVAESFIIQKGDPRFSGIKDHLGKTIDPAGGWGMILQVNDEDLKKAYREGEWNGVSLFSYAGDYELEEEDDPVTKALEDFQRRLHSEIEMDAKELADLLKENNKALLEALQKKEEPKEENKGGPDDGTPIFKGDFTDLDALKKYREEVKLHELRKKYDFNKPEELAKYIEELEKLKQESQESGEGDEGGKPNLGKSGENDDPEEDTSSPEISALAKQIEQLQKELRKKKAASKVPDLDAGPSDAEMNGLSKESAKAWEVGLSIGKLANEKRGYK